MLYIQYFIKDADQVKILKIATNNDEFQMPKLSNDNYYEWSMSCPGPEEVFGGVMSADDKRKTRRKKGKWYVLEDIGYMHQGKTMLGWLAIRVWSYALLQLFWDFFNTKKKEVEGMKLYIGILKELHRKLGSMISMIEKMFCWCS